MSYRKIIVDRTTYFYVIGKRNIHIRGVGDFLIADHGNRVARPGHDGKARLTDTYVATPKTVAALIRGESTPVRLENGQTLLMVDPREEEISDKTVYLPYDAIKYNQLWEDT